MSARQETGMATAYRVVILGAGYAGMAAAVQLSARVKRRGGVEVTVVNAQERFTERMRLHMTATGQRVAELSIPQLLDGTGARFVRGWVTAVDADAKTVRIDDDRVLPYDTLVYGLGSVADTSAVPGVEDHTYTLSSAQDAELLADRLGRLGSGTVVVVGSGLTGIESAAEIAERHPELNVVLLGRTEPGAAMNPKAKAYVHAALERLGVRVRTGVEVVKALPDAVELAGGESIAADAVLWTSGTPCSSTSPAWLAIPRTTTGSCCCVERSSPTLSLLNRTARSSRCSSSITWQARLLSRSFSPGSRRAMPASGCSTPTEGLTLSRRARSPTSSAALGAQRA
ncbi:NAD(P)/FAD-dependent oxidoreductase [Streptomyces sp. NPDC056821]|uniref:NAD(P)/FAD-dependent oxidoreductase n=1 Tax=unclassified Streptomyces TaxID=2593676 RepID=UPI0036897050